MFWTKGKGWYWNAPMWAPEDGSGGGGGADSTVDDTAAMYPEDKPNSGANFAADSVAETETDGNEGGNAAPDAADPEKADPVDPEKADGEVGDWKPYEDDPNKTDEENAAAKLENDLKHPINQVPEDGKYTPTLPEGMELDQGLLDAIGPVASELKLSNGHFQMLVDKFIEANAAGASQRQQDWAKTVSDWGEQAQNDPDMGGAKWEGTKTAALSVITRFGTPELKTYLEASGAGNHPEVIRLMAKVGAMIGEDVPAITDMPGNGGSADLSLSYPDDQPKGK